MARHACPHCGQNGISSLRKQFLGPALPANCSECGRKVGVPFGRTFLSLAPWFVAIFLLPLVRDNGGLSFVVGALGVLGSCLLFESIVPLEKR